mmetsp:Transcript_48736/g.72383  ORF Transcript_48736/g.72383 Transcript_48736/m.72383 type:complete len:93 (-) Transcript_48736:92-370(-)
MEMFFRTINGCHSGTIQKKTETQNYLVCIWQNLFSPEDPEVAVQDSQNAFDISSYMVLKNQYPGCLRRSSLTKSTLLTRVIKIYCVITKNAR